MIIWNYKMFANILLYNIYFCFLVIKEKLKNLEPAIHSFIKNID